MMMTTLPSILDTHRVWVWLHFLKVKCDFSPSTLFTREGVLLGMQYYDSISLGMFLQIE